MNKAEEIKFLMSYYEKIKANNTYLSKNKIDKLFCEQIEKLIKDDDISKESFDMVKSIYDIEQVKPKVSQVQSSNVNLNVDSCGRSYSGSRSGGC